MKKILFILITSYCINFQVSAQIAFYDAQKLSGIKSEDIDIIINVFLTNDISSIDLKRTSLKKGMEDNERFIKTALETEVSLKKVYKNASASNKNSALNKYRAAINYTDQLRKESISLKLKFEANEKKKPFLNVNEVQQLTLLKKFLMDPFDDQLDPLDFNIIYPALLKAKQVSDENSKDEDGAFAVLASIIGAVPTLISGVNSINGKTESNVIDGLSKYIAEEFKKGVTASYVNVFEKKLDSIGELQLLFPQTYTMLKNRNPFTYPDFGKEWKTTVDDDLKTILPHLIAQIENPDLTLNTKILTPARIEKIRNQPAFGYALISTDIASKLVDKYHPVDLFTYLDDKYYESDYKIGKLKDIIHGLQILQSNLRDSTTAINGQLSNVWVSFEEFKQLNTPTELKLFAGLLYQQDKAFFGALKQQVVVNNQFKIDQFKKFYIQKIQPIQVLLNKIQEYYEDLKDQEDFLDYMRFFIDVLIEINTAFNPKTDIENIALAKLLLDTDVLKPGITLEKLTNDALIIKLIDKINNPELDKLFILFRKNHTKEEFLAFLKTTAVSKLRDFQVLEQFSNIEDQIKFLMLSENCNYSLEVLKLIQNKASSQEILDYVLKSTFNNLSINQVEILRYKDDVVDIIHQFKTGSRISERDFETLLSKLQTSVDHQWIDLFEHVWAIYQSVKDKDYSRLIVNTLPILKLTIGEQFNDISKKKIEQVETQVTAIKKDIDLIKSQIRNINNERDNLANKIKLDVQSATLKKLLVKLEAFESNKNYQQIERALRKYLPFLIEIANAENSDDMKNIISSLVAPSNTYAKKRVSPLFVTITAHPGFYGSREELSGTTGWNFGLTAPIGFEIGKGIFSSNTQVKVDAIKFDKDGKKLFRTGHSLSAFIQLLDIGAILNYRLGDDSTDELPTEVTFEQVFSPGFSINWGLKNTPITLGLGYQRTARLREVNTPQLDDMMMPIENASLPMPRGNRYFIRLSWDLPLINLYAKSN